MESPTVPNASWSEKKQAVLSKDSQLEPTSGASDKSSPSVKEGEGGEYLTGYKVVVILVSLSIPVISERFEALEDVSWYVSAYFLTNCAFQLLYGRLYTLYSVKPIYLGAVGIFEIGSLICATAPNSTAFILGRAIAGLGSAMFYMFCVGAHFFILVYFLPIWFQGLRGRSALQSGIDTLPILLAQTLFVLLGGIIVSITGHYMPLAWTSVAVASVGAGLLTTLNVDSSAGKWIGYQIIYGIGGGLGYQQGVNAAPNVLGPTEIAIGTALMVFVQNLGGTIFFSATNNVFVTRLIKNLARVSLELDPKIITSAGATGIKQAVKPDEYPAVLVAYNGAVTETFKMALIFACLGALGAAGMGWRGQTKKKLEKDAEIEAGGVDTIETKQV